jgi:hypothetical protein
MSGFELLLAHLRQPEYVHVLLHPLPIFGMAIGALLLLGGFFWKNTGLQIAALLLIAATSAGTAAVIEFGEESYDRIESISAPEALPWMKVHEERAERCEPVFFGTGFLAALSLILLWKKPALAKAAVLLTVAAAAVSSMGGGWVAQAGGQIRHSEFRSGPPPALPQDKD